MTPEQLKALNIPDEFHNETIFKEAPDLPAVFKITRDLNAYKGNSIRIPGPEAGDTDKKEFTEKLKKHAPTLVEIPAEEDKREAALLDRLGVPKEAKEYAPPKDHGLPEPVVERLRAEAKEEGLTKKQFERRIEREKKAAEARTAEETKQQKALKEELGPAMEERLTAAAAAAKTLGVDAETVEAIRTGKVSASVAKTYMNAAKALGTAPGDLGGNPGTGPKTLTKDEARARISEIYKNPAFTNKAHPDHTDLMSKLLDYNRIVHGEG